MNTMAGITTRITKTIITVSSTPCIMSGEVLTESIRAPGRRAMMLAKMMRDMPLPMPRWVMSSPIHMMKAVPATKVTTMMMLVSQVGRPLLAKLMPNWGLWKSIR